MVEQGGTLTIVRSAIRDPDGTVYHLPQPARHHNVIRQMHDLGMHDPKKGEQGFITSEGLFVNRKEAKLIAVAADQLLERASKQDELYSECVW